MVRRERIGSRAGASLAASAAAHAALLVLASTARLPATVAGGEVIAVSVLPGAAAPARERPPQARSARPPRGRARATGPVGASRAAGAALPLAAAVPGPSLASPSHAARPGAIAFAGEGPAAAGATFDASREAGGRGAGPLADPDSSWLRKHQRSIERRIQREMDGTPYPHQARRMWWTGRVSVSFTLQPDGHVRDVRVVRSSGREVLDRCAVETVIDAAPFPRPPIDQEVEVPFEFRLTPL